MNQVRAFFSQIFAVSYLEFVTWKLAVLGLVFLNLWAFFGDDALPPTGSFFHLWMIFIAAHFAGKVVHLFNLPPLLGMMIAGNINKESLLFSHFTI